MRQPTLFIANAHGDAVHLGFDGELCGLSVEIFGDPVEKIAQLLLTVGIIKALHGHGVPDGAEGVERGAPHFLGRGIFVRQLRVGLLEILQLAVKAVIGRVGNFRPCLDVVEMVVAADFRQ